MTLTDKQKDALNRACALMCGRRLQEVFPMNPEDNKGYTEEEPYFIACNHPEEQICFCCELRDYCTDRNALPEVWEAVEKADCRSEFLDGLLYFCHPTINSEAVHQWLLITAEPPFHIRAALESCGKWTPELAAIMEETA